MLVSQLLRGCLAECATGYLMIGAIQPQDLCAVPLAGPLLDADGGAIVPVGGGGDLQYNTNRWAIDNS